MLPLVDELSLNDDDVLVLSDPLSEVDVLVL